MVKLKQEELEGEEQKEENKSNIYLYEAFKQEYLLNSIRRFVMFLIFRHVPKAKATIVADTPEMKRLAENSKNQSNVSFFQNLK